MNLSEVNQNLFLRVQNLQTERLEVLRDKQHCEDLFFYFKEKSNKIYLMNAKLSKLIHENEQGRKIVWEFISLIEKQNSSFSGLYSEKELLLKDIIEEFKHSLYLAQYHYDTFKADLFLYEKEEEKKPETGPSQKEIKVVQLEEPKEEESTPSLQQSQTAEPQFQVTSFDRENYAKAIAKLNRAVVENEHLKERIELQDQKINELSKDLVLFQKKAKLFADTEQKIDQMVGENIQLKTLLEDFQKTAIANSKDVQDDVKAF